MAELEEPLRQQPSPTHYPGEQADYPTYVVVGTGPVGIRCAQKLLQYSQRAQVVLFGAEAESPYNRVRLSQYLAEQLSLRELRNPATPTDDPRLSEFLGCPVASIDRAGKTITDARGRVQPYSKLILATGSTPLVPPIPGVQLNNVHLFRSLADTEKLMALRRRGQRICVIGAGALGLEAAAALKAQNNRVTLQSRGPLLSGQLGGGAGGCLESSLQALGVEVKAHCEITALEGGSSVEKIRFSDGEFLDVDAVVVCTGIQPEVSLARQCGLETGRGIVVSEWLQTSDPDIYAVGECAEYGQRLYQLVRPGYEQVESCCSHICQAETRKPYRGSRADIQLKIAHIPCAVIGRVQSAGKAPPASHRSAYSNRFKGIYRELHLDGDNRIHGAVCIGEWEEVNKLRKAIDKGEEVSRKALERFERDGHLWQAQSAFSIKEQPDDYLVCQCNDVSKGQLCTAISQGKRTLTDLQQATNAGSVCGSCQPLVAELLDAPVPNLVMRHAGGILALSILSLLLIALALFMPPAPISETVQSHWYWQKLWYDNFWKQVSGYTLLGFCLLTATLSLRKRLRKITYGHVDHWRYVHSVFGCAALVVLVVHTGFRLGENLNLALMLVFLAATTTGALVGVFMARNHHWTDLKLREHRKWWSRVHYALLWALPVLLGYHILAVYYF